MLKHSCREKGFLPFNVIIFHFSVNGKEERGIGGEENDKAGHGGRRVKKYHFVNDILFE